MNKTSPLVSGLCCFRIKLIAQYVQLTTYHSTHSAHYLLLNIFCTLLITQRIFAHYLLLNAFCRLLITQYILHTTYFSTLKQLNSTMVHITIYTLYTLLVAQQGLNHTLRVRLWRNVRMHSIIVGHIMELYLYS